MSERTTVAKERINSLTATRGIAALCVIIFHFGCEIYPFNKVEHFFRGANVAVSYFFVLSGFVMSWTYLGRSVGYGEFLKRRAVRIFPFYYLAIVMALILPLYYLARNNTPLESQFSLKLFLNGTFLQAYFPKHALSINSPGWSLSVEVFFYLLFPFFLKFQQRSVRLFSWFVMAVYITSQLLHSFQLNLLLAPDEVQHNFIHYFPLFHLNEFLVGMVGASLLPYFIKRGVKVPAFAILVVIVLIVNYHGAAVSIHNGLLAPLFLVLILSLSSKDAKWMKGRLLVFTGEMSYGLYILQFPVYLLFDFYNLRYFHLGLIASFYTYLGCLFLTTVVAHYSVEKPLRKLIRRGT